MSRDGTDPGPHQPALVPQLAASIPYRLLHQPRTPHQEPTVTRRPRLLPTATAGAMAALLLAGCGGGGDGGSKGNDKIAGADTGGSASASPSASATPSSERPKIVFPSDAKNV